MFFFKSVNVITGDMYTSVLSQHSKHFQIGFTSRDTSKNIIKSNKTLYKLLICEI